MEPQKHVGKRPSTASAVEQDPTPEAASDAVLAIDDLAELRAELEKAVQAEAYEQAALYVIASANCRRQRAILIRRTVDEVVAMKLQSLVTSAPSWLSGEDDAAGIVISCRARLARNVSTYPFGARINEDEQAQVVASVLAAAKGCKHMSAATFYNMELLDKNERRLLVERHLISPNLADAKGQRGVLFNSDESLSVMINEEDHLRIQSISPRAPGGCRLGEGQCPRRRVGTQSGMRLQRRPRIPDRLSVQHRDRAEAVRSDASAGPGADGRHGTSFAGIEPDVLHGQGSVR